jgi:hypothetical protein
VPDGDRVGDRIVDPHRDAARSDRLTAPSVPQAGSSIARRAGTCPRCGLAHNSAARYCRGCGLDFDSAETASLAGASTAGPSPARERVARRSATLAKIAGLAWILIGTITLAGFISDLLGDGTIAAWAGASALLELVTGLALFLRPGWEMLTASMLWGVLSIIGALFQVTLGVPPSSTAVVLVAGITVATAISWLARRPLLAEPGERDAESPPG